VAVFTASGDLLIIHYGVYGENSASHILAACGEQCSTWDKPLNYVWEKSKTTCEACLKLAPDDPVPLSQKNWKR
jgi:hypothetical protein